MPKPLSVTIDATCHIMSSIEALQIYHDLDTNIYTDSSSVSSAKMQFDCIADALNTIKDALLLRPELAVAKISIGNTSVGHILQSTMAACASTFSFITDTLYQLIDKSREIRGEGTTGVQCVRLWNASDIETGLKHVSILFSAMQILQSALISEDEIEMKSILTTEKSQTIFAKVACNAHHMLTKASRSSLPSMSSSPNQVSPVSENDDLNVYFANSTMYRNAWATARNRGSVKPIPQQCDMRPDHKHLARAMASFRASPQNPDQLSFRRCDLLEVEGLRGPWWEAKKGTGEIGLVPSDYLSLFDARLPLHNDIDTRVVKAVYSYVADPSKPGELSFEKDEVMEATDMEPGWWFAMKRSGESGVVPASYFILDGDARADTAHSLTNLPLPPPPYSQVPEKPMHTTYQRSVNTAVMEPPDNFSFLDHPPIARAVWEAPD